MNTIFTQFFTFLLAAASIRQHLFRTAGALIILLIVSVGASADIGITTTATAPITISADLAKNSISPAGGVFTAIGTLTISETATAANDFGSSNVLSINAPEGYEFYAEPDNNIQVVASQDDNGRTFIVAAAPTVSANKISIGYSGGAANRTERLTVSGIRIRALDGRVIPAVTYVTVTAQTTLPGLPANAIQINGVAGTPKALAFKTDLDDAFTGASLPTQPVILVKDQFGNTVTNATNAVTLAIGTNPSGGTLTGTLTVNAVGGVAALTNLSINNAGIGYTLTASSTNLPPVTSNSFTVHTPPVITSLSPNCILEGNSGGFTVIIRGTGFVPGAMIRLTPPIPLPIPLPDLEPASEDISPTAISVMVPSIGALTFPAGNYQVQVINPETANNGVSNTSVFYVQPNLAPDGIIGLAQLCSGAQSVTYSAPAGFQNYAWSFSEGATIASGQGTNQVRVNFAATAGSVRIDLTATGCTSTSNATRSVTVISTAAPTATITTGGALTTFCQGGAVTLTANANTGATLTWFRGSTQVASGPGNTYIATQTGNYTVQVSNGTCTSTSAITPVTVTPRDTYTLLLTVAAADFPVCGRAAYTAHVIKNITGLVYPTNPRYEQVTWTGGIDVTSQFIFDWWKNDTNDRINGDTDNEINQTGLQSTEFYTVRARPNATHSCFIYKNEFIPPNPAANGNVLYSNRIYLGRPAEFSVSIQANPTGPICPGNTVTFTAVPNNLNFIDQSFQWLINGQTVTGETRRQFSTSLVKDGDVVSVLFDSFENRCNAVSASNPIRMAVNSNPVISRVTSSIPTCLNRFLRITVNATGTDLAYQWYKRRGNAESIGDPLTNGGNVSGATSAMLSVSNVTNSEGGYYYVVVRNICNQAGIISINSQVTINPVYTNTIDLVEEPPELIINQPARYAVTPSNNSLVWTYTWTILYSTSPTPETFDTGTEPNFTIASVRPDMAGISVMQSPPPGIPCVDAIDNVVNLFRTPLPVELLYLKARRKANNVVELEWATAMEKMNEGFQIEVSQDAKNYRTLSFVPTKNGNTNQKQVYTFHDKENGKYGTRYYRIKQLDVDGTSEYFGPKAVKMDEISEQMSAYPNPFTSEINLEVNAEAAGSMHVIVSSAVGAKVLERTVNVQKGTNKAQLQLNPNLPLGMYIITTRLNGKTSHIKLMKE